MNRFPDLWSLLHSIYPPLSSDLSFLRYVCLYKIFTLWLKHFYCFLTAYKMKNKFLEKVHQALSNLAPTCLSSLTLHHATHTSATHEISLFLLTPFCLAQGVCLPSLHVENCLILHDSTEMSLL